LALVSRDTGVLQRLRDERKRAEVAEDVGILAARGEVEARFRNSGRTQCPRKCHDVFGLMPADGAEYFAELSGNEIGGERRSVKLVFQILQRQRKIQDIDDLSWQPLGKGASVETAARIKGVVASRPSLRLTFVKMSRLEARWLERSGSIPSISHCLWTYLS
jgi:hypothetical protein